MLGWADIEVIVAREPLVEIARANVCWRDIVRLKITKRKHSVWQSML